MVKPGNDVKSWINLAETRNQEASSNAEQEPKTMTRPVILVFVSVMSSVAFAQSPKNHLLIYRTEHDARQHCRNDAVVWADTRNHVLYLPRDAHYAHTHGGYACESQARAIGYRGPRAHA